MALIFFKGGESGLLDITSYLGTTCSALQSKTGSYSYFIANGYLIQSLLASYTELYCSLAYRVATYAAAPTPLEFRLNGTSVVSVQCPYTGPPILYVGATSVATGISYIPASIWHILEIHIKIHSSNGLVHFRINGLDEIIYTGNTAIAASSVNEFRCASSNSSFNVDDIVCNDTTGSVNNSWMGGSKVVALRPIGPGYLTQWTPSTGANWQCVDEVPVSDSDYVMKDIAGSIDFYDLATLGAGISTNASIQGVKVFNSILRSGLTPSFIKNAIRTNAVDAFSNTIEVPLTLLQQGTIWDLNPITGTTWSYTDVNALEAGVKLV